MKKPIKLEIYLLFTNLFQGLFWIISALADCVKNVPIPIRAFMIVLMSVFVISDIFVVFSKRESFDEFSRTIKQKADSFVLVTLICVMVIAGVMGEATALFEKNFSVPWYVLVKMLAGIAYCSQYCAYIAIEKRILSDPQGELNVED